MTALKFMVCRNQCSLTEAQKKPASQAAYKCTNLVRIEYVLGNLKAVSERRRLHE